MSSRIVILFNNTGHESTLVQSVETFLMQNASDLDRFKIVLHLYRPDQQTVDTVKSRFLSYTPHIIANSKPPCVPCILQKHRVRYGIVVPTDYVSVAPLWNYIDEMQQILSTVPNLSHIRLIPDTDLYNKTTNSPLVYHYNTRHIMLGNGNALSTEYPALIKSSKTKTSKQTTVSGVLRPVVFSKVEG